MPYAGWPATKTQLEQYGRAPRAFLPGSYTIRISGQPGPEKVLTGIVATRHPAPARQVAVELK